MILSDLQTFAELHFVIAGIVIFISVKSSKTHNPNVIIAFRNGQANLSCQYTPVNDSNFNLTVLKGDNREAVCVVYTDGMDTKFYKWEDQVSCDWRKSKDNTLGFTLLNLDTKHTNTYICHLQIFYPPPQRNHTVNETYVYIHDSTEQSCNENIMWISIGLAIFIFLSLIGILLLLLQRKCYSKCGNSPAEVNTEHNSEYMPMASVNAARIRAC
ncbi:inducible T-cell costimulator [Pelodytes ibericus]